MVRTHCCADKIIHTSISIWCKEINLSTLSFSVLFSFVYCCHFRLFIYYSFSPLKAEGANRLSISLQCLPPALDPQVTVRIDSPAHQFLRWHCHVAHDEVVTSAHCRPLFPAWPPVIKVLWRFWPRRWHRVGMTSCSMPAPESARNNTNPCPSML